MKIGQWTLERSAEGILLVFGDGKYPHDPPRVASRLEEELARRVEAARMVLTETV